MAAQQARPEIVDPALFRGIYEQTLGIPTSGRDVYSGWLANRWQDAVNQWALATTPEFATEQQADVGQGYRGDSTDLSFRDWLKTVMGTPAMFGVTGGAGARPTMADIVGNIQAMDPGRLREYTGEGGILAEKGARGAFDYAALRDLQSRFGRLGGSGIFRQAFSAPAERAAILAEAQPRFDEAGRITPAPDTFLQQRIANLRGRYGF